MKAHWIDDSAAQGAPIPPAVLAEEGVLYQSLPTEPSGYQDTMDHLKGERGYIEQDQVALTPDMDNLDAICAKFIDEHLHDEDEVRFVLEGEGVFEIRARDERWMKVEVEPGDLIIVPAKRYHRFYLSDSKTIRCVRLFRDKSGWVPHYRQAS
ncbi:1,2-dihydroxy-3-keto-5-methylthiopentene dioxygenase [Haliangium ochraceum]|uniref:acireductone dioxygenase (Fe(2+)-requiring) n=1 Tax=Haliangium ochraceum (strain DSM 14365 / JCM 11303 / SMP-2) TaxID=502025 RepID=D0LL26_HALO1|nr:cupin domain-containing protein [Haliangium ochraceum]ACY16746.1 Acireductone dioxygenase ARD [Haliangium ochraceum DSM 14365]